MMYRVLLVHTNVQGLINHMANEGYEFVAAYWTPDGEKCVFKQVRHKNVGTSSQTAQIVMEHGQQIPDLPTILDPSREERRW